MIMSFDFTIIRSKKHSNAQLTNFRKQRTLKENYNPNRNTENKTNRLIYLASFNKIKNR